MTGQRSGGRFLPADRDEQLHRYVAVTVPEDAPALSVTLAYDRTAGVLDLGIFDPHGRFRGYSGGARDGFVLTAEEATPGYLPGPLAPGEWQVLLRLHRIPPDGLDWELEASTAPTRPASQRPPPDPGPAPPRRGLPAAAGSSWLAGDLHAHTVHSDGTATIDELAALARRRGLDFLAVTDHNTTSHHPHLPAAADRTGVVLVPGQEVTTDVGHANCFGDVGWVDFREPADAWVAHAERHGGLLSLNHPVAGDCAWRQRLSRPPTHVEAWHGPWDRRSSDALRWWRSAGGVPLGGADVHDPARGDLPGAPTTWVCARDDEPIVAAMAAGRTAIAADPRGPVLLRVDEELVAVDAAGLRCLPGEVLLTDDGQRCARAVIGDRERLGAADGWHVLLDGEGRVAALSP